jgi:hypothetical protein
VVFNSIRFDYSLRRASIGSTFAARLAGNQIASPVTNINNAATAT